MEPSSPVSLILAPFGMLPTVHFDDEAGFKTNKIGNVPADECLPAEFVARKR